MAHRFGSDFLLKKRQIDQARNAEQPASFFLCGIRERFAHGADAPALLCQQQPGCGAAQAKEPHHRNDEQQIFSSHGTSGLESRFADPLVELQA